jgi:DDE superfamily endonuclease
MPVPIVCLDSRLRQWVAPFRAVWSKPQYQHFVTVLLGLLLCQGRCTLTDLLRQVAGGASLASVSRFLSHAPWSMGEVVAIWLARFQQQLTPQVAAEQERQRRARPPRRGRAPVPVVTGYLIGDDSTMAKPKGKKMGGLGRQYSSTAGTPVRGHSLVLGCYTLLGRRCPLAPQLYRQQAVCAAAGVPFQSKVALLAACIRTCRPVPGTRTPVLLDSW